MALNTSNRKALYRFDNCTVAFGESFELKSLNLTIEQNEACALLGPSGSGKSALIAALAGAGQVRAGTRTLNCNSLAEVSLEAQASLIAREAKREASALDSEIFQGTPARDLLAETGAPKATLAALANALGLHPLLDRAFRKLSTGETRRLLLARALASQADCLLLDQPYAGLDAPGAAQLSALLAAEASRRTLVLALNRLDQLPDFIDRVIYLQAGQIRHDFTTAVTTPLKQLKPQLRQLLHISTTPPTLPPPPPPARTNNSPLEGESAIVRASARASAGGGSQPAATNQPSLSPANPARTNHSPRRGGVRQSQSDWRWGGPLRSDPQEPPHPPLNPDGSLVRLRKGKVEYANNLVFKDLDWQIFPGEHWQVTGPNGSGKTCLLGLIIGDHPQCYANDLRIFGHQRGSGETIWDIKRHLGFVSTALHWDYRLRLSVRQVILSGFHDSIGLYAQPSEAEEALASEWLELLGMAPQASESFARLSYGQQRLLLIARACVKRPPLILLDEPCLGLDDPGRELVLALIARIIEAGGTTIVYVAHQAEERIPAIRNILPLG